MGKNTQQKTSRILSNSKILREFSSGGAVFKKENNQTLWLVAKSNPSDAYPRTIWRLQKGWIDDRDGGAYPGPISSGEVKATEEELQNGAIREVREEGGVIAKIIIKIGTAKYFMNSTRGRVLKFVTYYLMEYVKDAPEGFCFETSEVLWLPINEAIQKLSFDYERGILQEAGDLVKKD